MPDAAVHSVRLSNLSRTVATPTTTERADPPNWTPALIDLASGWADQNGAFCAAVPVMSHVLAGLLAARTQQGRACFDRQACQDVGEPPLMRTGGHQRSVTSLGAGGRPHEVGGAGRGAEGKAPVGVGVLMRRGSAGRWGSRGRSFAGRCHSVGRSPRCGRMPQPAPGPGGTHRGP